MIVINKTKRAIDSFHRKRGEFLRPGSNDVDESTLSKSERAYIAALVHHGACEYGKAPPESGKLAIPEIPSETTIEIPPEAEAAAATDRPLKTRRRAKSAGAKS